MQFIKLLDKFNVFWVKFKKQTAILLRMEIEKEISKAFEKVYECNPTLWRSVQYDEVIKGLSQTHDEVDEYKGQAPAKPKSKQGKSRERYLAIASVLLRLNIRRNDAGAFFMRRDIHGGFRRNGIRKGINTSLERFVDEKIDTVLSDIKDEGLDENRGSIRKYKAVVRYVEIDNQKYGLIFYSPKRE